MRLTQKIIKLIPVYQPVREVWEVNLEASYMALTHRVNHSMNLALSGIHYKGYLLFPLDNEQSKIYKDFQQEDT